MTLIWIFYHWPHWPLLHELLFDSKELFETPTTLHTSEDSVLRATVARMRASFESRELNAVRWIPGVRNLSDALTKRNVKMSTKLNALLVNVLWSVDLKGSSVLDRKSWVRL